jgi:hypothetical protein
MRLLGAAFIVGAVVCALITISTFVAGAPHVPYSVAIIAALTTLPLVGAYVVLARRLPKRKLSGIGALWGDMCARLPVWAIILVAMAFYGSWLFAAATMAFGGPGGIQETRDGRYYLVNRNKATEVTRDEYLFAPVKFTRTFGFVGTAMHTGALALLVVPHFPSRRRP